LISRIALRWRWLRRVISRNVWSARIMGVKPPHGEAAEPGLVMIQIDGLSRTQFEKALEEGQLPFLKKLISRKHFTLETFYSGVPSTTPAVQGELFFGVRAAVPAFQFLRRSAGRDFRMYEAESALEIEEELLKKCDNPLLKDGHAYSNIYRAGASVTRYCSRDFAAQEYFKRLHPLKMLVLAIIYLPKLLRMTGLALLEIFIAFMDAVRGLYDREGLFRELAFVPARVAVCVVLREAIRFRVLLDIERGVRVIQANFLGYDEQSHRRGPGSAFAHWSLKAIDSAVRDIYKAAHDSRYRDYELMVYSDHGQEKSIPYPRATGKELDEALREVFAKGSLAGKNIWMRKLPDLLGNTVDRCRELFGIGPKVKHSETKPDPQNEIVVAAMGPLGHIYTPQRPDDTEMADYARELVYKARIPLVMFRGNDGTLHAFNRCGTWTLPENHAEVLGENHPFGKEAAADMVHLSEHPDAGEFMISGWSPDHPSITFPMENGSHGGPGSEETRGFLLVPDRIRRWHVAHISGTTRRVRGEELRQIALHYLGRDGLREERVMPREGIPSDSLRVMTYNIHSCMGVDSKIRPERIARVINHFDPDIVAVQEVDCHRRRTGGQDQAQLIADHLRMSHVFEAMLEDKNERYGIAIFSRYPLEVMKSGFLTKAVPARFQEARGAIWVKLEREEQGAVHFINTHFGLGKKERVEQLKALAGDTWLGAIPPDEPVILCGDFNAGPKSRIFRMLTGLHDAQLRLDGHKPRATFFSTNPVLRLDHVFISKQFTVKTVDVPVTPTARVASDHLPLCVELEISPHGTEN
jgi:endonuclease/exonuclease/phosphatase family metal-dependent hydrolase